MADIESQTTADLRAGLPFRGWLLVKEATIRQTANGKSFLDLRLVDSYGTIPAKAWEYEKGLEPSVGTILWIEGSGNLYNGHLQLRVDRFRFATPADGKSPADFMPHAPETPETMLEEIRETVAHFSDPSLRDILAKLLEWANADGRLLTAPAARTLHHAELGGLLYHTITILRAAKALMTVYRGLDRDLLYAGIIAHDLAKLDEMRTNELGLVDDYSVDGNLIGHIVRGIVNIERAAGEVGANRERATLLQHLVLSHHGKPEFGSPVRPAVPEALILSALDCLDAHLYQINSTLKTLQPGQFSPPVWGLENTKVYRPVGENADAAIRP